MEAGEEDSLRRHHHVHRRAVSAGARWLEQAKLDFLQVDYSIDNRGAEEKILPLAREKGVAVLINVPLGGRRGNVLAKVAGKPLPAWAADYDATSWAQLFLKYNISHPAVTAVIPGTTKLTHLQDNQLAGRGRLPDAKGRKSIEEFWATLPERYPRWGCSQRSNPPISIAPDCRAISRPCLNAIRVGMPRMPKREDSDGSSSEFTLAKRALVCSRRDASSKCGAIMRQGPHQGAQKSTISGRSLRVRCLSNDGRGQFQGMALEQGVLTFRTLRALVQPLGGHPHDGIAVSATRR